ncbi:hypothetical protein SDRG_07371 [Saprolegnia diclina VS20]|uniref:Uncharacterized protein n=1 Tax=Saprolegnia diclina (strain VS20) TaxID=1156394 RepID=T0RRM6_SAPDV|nr:hypothetical protein SDRG_07371 [Saprolegnia diclina VS20]EQC35138.1 hypothetical protein SDRG_07371 [Saprolegnia diclina VS20]|eukprot:XP_008611422.1 hypothetical protein SDRG_07371 [Saprolegnia diclina VS20]
MLTASAWCWATTTALCLVHTLIHRAQAMLAWLGNVGYDLCMRIVLPRLQSLAVAACTVLERTYAWLQRAPRRLYTVCSILVRKLISPFLQGFYCVLYQAVDITCTVLLILDHKLYILLLLMRDAILRPLARVMQTTARYVGRTVRRVLARIACPLQRLLKATATALGRLWRCLVAKALRCLDVLVATSLRIIARCVRAFWRLWRGLHSLVVGLLDFVFRLLLVCKNVCTSPPMMALYASVKALLAVFYASLMACLAAVYASSLDCLSAVYTAMRSAGAWASTVTVATWQVAVTTAESVAHVTSVIVRQLLDVVSAIVFAAVQVAYDVAGEVQRMSSFGSKAP